MAGSYSGFLRRKRISESPVRSPAALKRRSWICISPPAASIRTVEQRVPKIKELVVNSIEGLAYERVSVVLVNANVEDVPTLTAAAPWSAWGSHRDTVST